MNFLRFIFFILIGYYIYRVVKNLLVRRPDNPHVKGNERKNDSIQKQYKNKIEDADFEEIE